MADTLNIQPIILAAGKGTRMKSALPKVLVGLVDRPLIQHLLDNLKSIQFSHPPVIVVGHKYELVQSYLGTNLNYAFQEGQLGTAHAAQAGLSKAEGENVLVLYGDMPFIKPLTIQKLASRHQALNSNFSMLTALVPNFENEFSSFQGFGRIIRDSDGQLLKIQEFVDASPKERDIREVNPGIYLFKTDWLRQHLHLVPKNKHGEHYLTDMLELAIKEGQDIATDTVDPLEVYGINTPQQLKQAEALLR